MRLKKEQSRTEPRTRPAETKHFLNEVEMALGHRSRRKRSRGVTAWQGRFRFKIPGSVVQNRVSACAKGTGLLKMNKRPREIMRKRKDRHKEVKE